MLRVGAYRFKLADTPEEWEQIHRLNYRTFVQEIPQHHDTGSGQLIDKFHDKNNYITSTKEQTLVGMISVCDQPPFSITARLPDPEVLRRDGVVPAEIRLLAVVPEERKSPVLAGLVWTLYQHAKTTAWTHFVISGVSEQLEMYTHLGFESLGPPVGSGRATFIPMWLPVRKVEETMGRSMQLWQKRLARQT
jgi:hypothetical protein